MMFCGSRLGLVLLLLLASHGALAEERHALVIGNSKYDGEAALRNPVSDADAIEATLKKLNFTVTKKVDLEKKDLEKAVVDFHKSLKKGSVTLFFYAGHGLQVKGENYLVPLKAGIEAEFEVKEKCYKVDQVISAMEDSESALKILILDCCRDNPFSRSWKRSTAGKGMAAITEIPNGTVIAFATAPGQTAADGRGANSPYTTHLVASLNARPKDGLELKAALFAASRAVKKENGQAPWLNLDASLDEFYLWRASASTTATAPQRDPSPPKAAPRTSTPAASEAATQRAKAFFPLNKGQVWSYGAGGGTHTLSVVDIDERGANIETSGGAASQAMVAKADGVYAVRSGEFYFSPPYKMLALDDGKPAAKGTKWSISHKHGDVNITGTGEVISDREVIRVPAGQFATVVVRLVMEWSGGKSTNTYWFAPGYGVVKQVSDNATARSTSELATFRRGS